MSQKIYLTFDDGPDENTEEILDLLNKYNIKATFFNLGCQEEKNPELVKRLVSEGHSLGNHTWSHNPEIYQNKRKFIDEVRKVHELQTEILGKEPEKIFRFPFESDKVSQEIKDTLLKEGYNYIDWNVYLQDGSRNPEASKAYKLALEGIKNSKEIPIILTHCERPEKTGPKAALELIIKDLLEQGYVFDSIKQEDKLVRF